MFQWLKCPSTVGIIFELRWSLLVALLLHFFEEETAHIETINIDFIEQLNGDTVITTFAEMHAILFKRLSICDDTNDPFSHLEITPTKM